MMSSLVCYPGQLIEKARDAEVQKCSTSTWKLQKYCRTPPDQNIIWTQPDPGSAGESYIFRESELAVELHIFI